LRLLYGARFPMEIHTLEDAIGPHSCSLEALACVRPMTFLSGVHCLLPVDTVNSAQTLQVTTDAGLIMGQLVGGNYANSWKLKVRCVCVFVFGRNLYIGSHTFALEDAIGSHAFALLEARACVWPMAFLSSVYLPYRFTL
jgi:hypothetical protein